MVQFLKTAPYLISLVLFTLFCNLSIAQDQDYNILWTVNWSHDSRFIAVGGGDQVIRIFDGKTQELVQVDSIKENIQRLRWHPTKNILAVAATGHGSRRIDFDQKKTTVLHADHELAGRAIAWNSDGSLLAVADYAGVLTIWDDAGNLIRAIKKDNTKSYVAVDWHPRKNEIIALGEYIRIYDVDGTLLHKMKHRTESVLMLYVQWHPSGGFYVIGDYGDYDYQFPALLQFWSSDHELIRESAISKAEYRNISWSPDGHYLATASEALRIWSTDGSLIYEGASPDLLWGVDWSPNGLFIVTSSLKDTIRLWDSHANFIKEL